MLGDWLSLLAHSPITNQMYEGRSFLLNPELRRIIQDLMATLDEFELPLEPVLFGQS